MKTLQDYIKLAESATDGPWTAYKWGADWHVANATDDSGAMLTVRSWHKDREPNAQFIAASRTLGPAMAKALIEAEEALRECKDEFWDEWHSHMSEGDFDNHDMIMSIDKALATIEALQENKNEQR